VDVKPDLATLLAQSEYEIKTGHRIRIDIQNGCGVPGLAKIYRDYIRAEGIDVLEATNAPTFSHPRT